MNMASNSLHGVACAAVLLISGSAWAATPIAVVGPMTGSNAAFGAQMRAGAEQAVHDINAAGGVLGQPVSLAVGDDACDPRQAVSVANEMAGRGVVFVDGEFCSGSSIPASHVYTEESVLQISPASTNPDYTDKGAWNTLRTCGRDDQQGAVAAGYIAAHARGATIAILDDNSAYGHGLAEQTRRALNAAGVKEALDATYTPGEKDYSALVSRLRQSNATLVYIGGYHPEIGLIARQARAQGYAPVIFGGDALVTDDYRQVAGPAATGTLMTFPPDPRRLASAAPIVAEFAAQKINPEGYVLYSYATVQVWAEAAKKAGSTDAQKVAAALHDGTPYETVVGPISFDAKGDPKGTGYVVYAWGKDGYGQL